MIRLPRMSHKNKTVIIVGTGGTGCILLQNIAHLCYDSRHGCNVIIIDGDIVEETNIGRQKFTKDDLGKNKAQCLAARYSDVFGLDIGYIPEYIRDSKTLLKCLLDIEGLPILVLCVDNQYTRQLAHQVFTNKDVQYLVYIDTGNEGGQGQTVTGLKWKGVIYQDPVASLFPDILTATDKIKEEPSCGQVVVEKPQTLIENIWSATIAMTYVSHIICNQEIPVHHTYFDVNNIRARSVENERVQSELKLC